MKSLHALTTIRVFLKVESKESRGRALEMLMMVARPAGPTWIDVFMYSTDKDQQR